MTFEIEIEGRARTVTVERARESAHHFRVTVDGVAYLVDAVQPTSDAWSLIVGESGGSHDVSLARGASPGELLVSIAGHTVAAIVNGRRVRRTRDVGPGTGAQRLVAPMPGKVLRVLVRQGDEVTPRQPLVVVEAMKMENELTSTRAGRVTQVAVREQALVEAGQLLLIIET
jgi:biotin carboxyl carrier protein